MRQFITQKQKYKASCKLANSEATKVPLLSNTPIETFRHEVEVDEVFFNTVKLFHPRMGECNFFSSFCCEADFVWKDGLGVVYMADPMVDGGTTLPMKLYVMTF